MQPKKTKSPPTQLVDGSSFFFIANNSNEMIDNNMNLYFYFFSFKISTVLNISNKSLTKHLQKKPLLCHCTTIVQDKETYRKVHVKVRMAFYHSHFLSYFKVFIYNLLLCHVAIMYSYLILDLGSKVVHLFYVRFLSISQTIKFSEVPNLCFKLK